MKIYIIEDDEAVISMLEDIIEGEGLGTVCGSSTDGYTDLIDIFAKAPDLVLTDLLMPGKDGIQLMRELKSSRESFFALFCRAKTPRIAASTFSFSI